MKTRARRRRVEPRTPKQFAADYSKLIRFMKKEVLHEDTRREIVYQAMRKYPALRTHCPHYGGGRGDHMVPIKAGIELLWDQDLTDEEVLDRLHRLCVLCTQADANRNLEAAGLRQQMGNDKHLTMENLVDQIRHRYGKAGINLPEDWRIPDLVCYDCNLKM